MYLIISGHFLSLYDWSIAPKPMPIGAFHRKYINYMGSRQIFKIPIQDQTILHSKFTRFTVVILGNNYKMVFRGGKRDPCTWDVACSTLESVKNTRLQLVPYTRYA